MKTTAAIFLFGMLTAVMGATLHCTTDNECGSDQCCTKPLIGRKRFLFGDAQGTCKPMAMEGQTCEPDLFVIGGSMSHTFGCPCAAGLECHGESESHQGGSHSYTNPRCVPAGSAGTATGTGSQPGSGSGGAGGVGPVVNPTQSPSYHTADPNQPIEELPGK